MNLVLLIKVNAPMHMVMIPIREILRSLVARFIRDGWSSDSAPACYGKLFGSNPEIPQKS